MISFKELVVLSLLLSPFTALHATTVYKWTDSEGNVHFGANPPPDQQADELQLPKSSVSPPAPAAKQPTASEPKKEEAATTTLKQHLSKNCEIATKNLKTYREHQYIVQADGSVKELSEETRQQKIKEMEAAVSKYCK